jgi:hypothetical protein
LRGLGQPLVVIGRHQSGENSYYGGCGQYL